MSEVNLADAPVESWNIEDIKPYAKNHKKHPPKQVEALARSIADQGLNDPITVDGDGIIISGHGRLQAIQKLGWVKVPVRCLRGLSKSKADKLRIAANKTSGNDYDVDILSEELERLSAIGEGIDDLGFDERELSMLMDDLGEMDEDITIDDVGEAISDFDEEVNEAAEEVAASEVSVAKVFGFTKMPLKTQGLGAAFMAEIQERTGKKGVEALIAHMEEIAGD